MVHQQHIFIAFFRASILGFGGGPSTIPLVKKEVVDTYQFVTEDEFTDILAIGNTLPGPIITKMAGYIGFRVGGVLGMINALLATIVPSAIMMIVALTALHHYKDEPFIQGMTRGVMPVIAVMMGVLTWEYMKKSTQKLGWKWAMCIFSVTFFTILVLSMHPGIIIVTLLIVALALPVRKGAAS